MTSVECLKNIIDKMGDDWKQKLDSYLKDEDIAIDNDEKESILEFFDVCKEEIINDKTTYLQKVEKQVDNDLLYKNIRIYVDGILKPYYATAPLRVLEVQDAEKTREIIDEIFKQTVLRYNPQIGQDYEKYGFDNQEIFIEFLNVLDAMCSFVVGKNFHVDTIEDFIYSNTRLSKKLCKQMTKIIDTNFEQLKINYIIEKLNE